MMAKNGQLTRWAKRLLISSRNGVVSAPRHSKASDLLILAGYIEQFGMIIAGREVYNLTPAGKKYRESLASDSDKSPSETST